MPYKDPEKNKECIRQWVLRNREKSREYQRAYRLRNTELTRSRGRKYRVEKIARVGTGYEMWWHAKKRAQRRGVPFSISITDIVVPETCAVFGFPISRSVGTISDTSPTLDCVVPSLGYVPGNVRVISQKANRLKNRMTLDEVLAIARYIEVNSTCR